MKTITRNLILDDFKFRLELFCDGELVLGIESFSARVKVPYDPFESFGDDAYYLDPANLGKVGLRSADVFELKRFVANFIDELSSAKSSVPYFYFTSSQKAVRFFDKLFSLVLRERGFETIKSETSYFVWRVGEACQGKECFECVES